MRTTKAEMIERHLQGRGITDSRVIRTLRLMENFASRTGLKGSELLK
jgi:hypothetical protein